MARNRSELPILPESTFEGADDTGADQTDVPGFGRGGPNAGVQACLPPGRDEAPEMKAAYLPETRP
jgi:hypothetical protein